MPSEFVEGPSSQPQTKVVHGPEIVSYGNSSDEDDDEVDLKKARQRKDRQELRQLAREERRRRLEKAKEPITPIPRRLKSY